MTTATARYPASAVADATGTAIAACKQLPVGVIWEIVQVSVNSPSGINALASLTLNNDVVAASSVGSNDVASGDPSLILRPGDRLVVTWIGSAPGTQYNAVFYYNEYSPTDLANAISKPG